MMRILVVGPSWIGDTVMSNSLYQLLITRYHGEVKIDVIAPRKCQPIISHMPEIHRMLFLPYTHGVLELVKCLHIGKSLRNKEYQQAIVLPNSFKSALIPFFAGISLRTGWRGEMRYGILNDLRVLDPMLLPLMVQRYVALSYDGDYFIKYFSNLSFSFPHPCLNINRREIEEILYKFNLNYRNKCLVGLCFGAALRSDKIWPHYHYVKLALYLVNCGYHVVILGCSSNKLICEFFENNILKNFKKWCTNLINKTSLIEVMAIIAGCKGVVSNDSGLLHIACALQCPVVGLYGPTDPNFTPPLSKRAVVLRCCVSKYYKMRKNNDNVYGYHHSLINIKAEQVFQALQTLLN